MSNISYFCGWSDDNLLKPYCWNRWSCYPHFCRLAGPGLQILQILPFCRIISASARDCDTFITYHGVDFWDWGGRMSTNTFMIMSLLWIHNIYIVSLNYLSQLLSKTSFTSEQFILILSSTFKPNGSLSSTVYSVLGHLSSIIYQPFDTALTGGFYEHSLLSLLITNDTCIEEVRIDDTDWSLIYGSQATSWLPMVSYHFP